MNKKFIEKLLVISITIIFCFFLLEINLRLLGIFPTNMTEGIYEKNGNSYHLKRNVTKRINWPSFSYTICTNSFGFRDRRTGEIDLNQNSYYVFLGASDAFGNGVNYEDSFIGIFSDFAQERGIKILNLSIGGHRFIDQELLFRQFLENISKKPLKLFFCVNPLTLSLFDAKYENILIKNGYLFEKNSWKLAYIKILVGDNLSSYCFFRDSLKKLYYNLIKSSKILPSHIKIYSKYNRMANDIIKMKFEQYLDNFELYCFQNQITPIYLYLPLIDAFTINELLSNFDKNPDDFDTSFYEKLIENHCQKRKIAFLSPQAVLKNMADKGISLRFTFDQHYNKTAHRVIGEYLIKEVFGEEGVMQSTAESSY